MYTTAFAGGSGGGVWDGLRGGGDWTEEDQRARTVFWRKAVLQGLFFLKKSVCVCVCVCACVCGWRNTEGRARGGGGWGRLRILFRWFIIPGGWRVCVCVAPVVLFTTTLCCTERGENAVRQKTIFFGWVCSSRGGVCFFLFFLVIVWWLCGGACEGGQAPPPQRNWSCYFIASVVDTQVEIRECPWVHRGGGEERGHF